MGKAINIVLGDRALALLVLVASMAITLPLFFERVGDHAARVAIAGIVAGGLAALVVFLLLGRRAAGLLNRFRMTRPLGDLARDFHRLFGSATVLVRLCFWSVFIHLLTVLVVRVLAGSLGVDVDFIGCLVVVPAIILATTIPISIAGWGVREGAMVFGFGQLGVNPVDALAISVLFGLAQLIVGLPGGILWLGARAQN